jgi:hypothetical protein
MKQIELIIIIFICSFAYSQDDIKKVFYDDGQLKEVKTIENGKLEGVCQLWYENGQLEYEGNFIYGRKNGTHKWWYENGQLEYNETYKNGRKNGIWKGWWSNGQLEYEGVFRDDKRDGIWKSFYENGQLKKEAKFILERRITEFCFSEYGEKMDCDENLESIWWWKKEKCLDEQGNYILCDEFYLGGF